MSKIDTSPAALRESLDDLEDECGSSHCLRMRQGVAAVLAAVADKKEIESQGGQWWIDELEKLIARGRMLWLDADTTPKAPEPNGHCPVLTAEREEAGRNVQAFVESQGGIGERPRIEPRSVAFQYRDEKVAEGMKSFYDAFGHKPPEGPKT